MQQMIISDLPKKKKSINRFINFIRYESIMGNGNFLLVGLPLARNDLCLNIYFHFVQSHDLCMNKKNFRNIALANHGASSLAVYGSERNSTFDVKGSTSSYIQNTRTNYINQFPYLCMPYEMQVRPVRSAKLNFNVISRISTRFLKFSKIE